jgi:hypothetical protein
MGRTRNLSNLVSDNIFSISSDGGIALGGGVVGINTINVVGIISSSDGLYGDAPNANASGQAANIADSDTSFTTTGIVTTTKELVGNGRGISGVGYTNFAYCIDKKDGDVGGGRFVDDAWQDRDLNYTFSMDTSNIFASQTINTQVILQPGKYFIEWRSPAIRTDHHWSRLYDVTNSTSISHGQTAYTNNANWYGIQSSIGAAVVSITEATTYKIQAWSDQDDNLTESYGTKGPDSSDYNEYAQMKIYKIG